MRLNFKATKDFINEHKDQVIDLFMDYQMIEMMLFLKLYLPDISKEEERENDIEEMNKRINSKTFGYLKNKYIEKFPDDDYNLKFDLESVAKQRNSFMHSIWIIIALGGHKEKVIKMGEILLNDFTKNANGLFDKVMKLPAL